MRSASVVAPGVSYVHGCFDEEFLSELESMRSGLPSETASLNMSATRRRFYSTAVADKVSRGLGLGFRASPHLRFIEYATSGFIAPHTDGHSFHADRCTTHTFLLYMTDTDDGGETEILESMQTCAVVSTVQPRRGSILVFPHSTPHQGLACGRDPKLLLRGDMIIVTPTLSSA